MLPDSPEYAALRADVEGNRLNRRFHHTHKNKSVKVYRVVEENRLNSRFQHIHKNKSVKAHGVVKENRLSFRMNIII